MAKNPHLTLENRYRVCREYSELWQQYFQMFSDDLQERQITAEMEGEFANLMNVIALNHFKFSELVGEFMKDPMDVVKILAASPSLESVRDMSDATRNKLLVQWHTTFLEMNKALGKILSQMTPKQLEAMQLGQQAADAQAAQPPAQ